MRAKEVRSYLFTFVALFFALAVETDACICLSDAPVCQRIAESDAVFLGQPLELIGDAREGRPKLYRFRVEKIYKGLTPKTVEVMVDPGSGFSCETGYTIGIRYLMFAGISSKEPLRLATSRCLRLRTVESSKDDIAFLDQYLQGKTTTKVFGKVFQHVPLLRSPGEEGTGPLEKATVQLRNTTHQFAAISRADGSFSFSDIPAGEYELTARLDPCVPDPPHKISVSAGACNQVFFELRANSRMEGILLRHDRKPAANQSVTLLKKKSSQNSKRC